MDGKSIANPCPPYPPTDNPKQEHLQPTTQYSPPNKRRVYLLQTVTLGRALLCPIYSDGLVRTSSASNNRYSGRCTNQRERAVVAMEVTTVAANV